MASNTCVPSLQSILDRLSDTQPTPTSSITPYLAVSRPSARYNHVNEYKTLLGSFEEARHLLSRIIQTAHDFETKLDNQEKGVRNALAPVHALPAECMREIFHCLAADTSYCDKGRTLSQVCAFWRSVALSTPEVWTHVRDLNTALIMTRLNREKQTKFPLRLTMSAKSSYLEDLKTAEGKQALDEVLSLRVITPIGVAGLICRPPPKLQELILCSVASDMWRGDVIDDIASLSVSSQGRSFFSVQLYGCAIKIRGMWEHGPEEIVISSLPVTDAIGVLNELVSEAQHRLHLHRIGRAKEAGHGDSEIRRFVQSMGLRESIPVSLALDRCPPELCIACFYELGRVVGLATMKDFQISVPDLRLEPPDVVSKLRAIIVVLPSRLKATRISVSAPFHWIFDLLEATVTYRSERLSLGRKLSPLQLRLTVPEWSFFRDYGPQHLALKMDITHRIDALVTGFEAMVLKCCSNLTRLPNGDEYAIDYEYAKYPREHYGFTS